MRTNSTEVGRALFLTLVRTQALAAQFDIVPGQTLDGLLRLTQDGARNGPKWLAAERRTLERILQVALLCGQPGSLELAPTC